MPSLNQDDIDALLQSAQQAAEADPADVGDADRSAAQGTPHADLPDDLKLIADNRGLNRLYPVQVPVIVRLAETDMPVDQILGITVGTIIEFDKSADADLDLVVNNVPIGIGNAVKCGENFGLRVIRIQPLAQRYIQAGLYR